MNRIETTILKNLITNEDYSRKVLPFLKPDYFIDSSERIVFSEIAKFIQQYNALPTHEALTISLNEKRDITENELKESISILESIEKNKEEKSDFQWLVDNSEAFCKEKALHNAISESINILDNPVKAKKTKDAIPSILTEALGVTFDPHVGHDYLEDSEKRFDFYHHVEERIPFDIDIFNKITNGGLPNKTLNVFMGGTGFGKAQPKNLILKVPGGIKKFGELKIGDLVYGSDGKPTLVTGVFPQGFKKVYEIEFSDGRKTYCCKEHLWKVFDASNKLPNKWNILTTAKILEYWNRIKATKTRFYVPLTKQVSNPENKGYLIHPYFMGIILGDGHISQHGAIRISVGDRDREDILPEIYKHIQEPLYFRKRGINYFLQGKPNYVSKEIQNLGLISKKSFEKFIPKIYLNGSSEQRTDLLRGLLDSNGFISKGGSISYRSTSKVMAGQVVDLVRGLGGISYITPKKTFYTYKNQKLQGRTAYSVSIRIPRDIILFTSKFKKERYERPYQYNNLKLRIKKITKIGNEDCQCISVAAGDHLYLTNDYIVTHNTLIMGHIAAGALTQGFNVLYITLEMAEERIAERIDANLLNVELDDLLKLPKELYDRKVEKIRAKTQGKLIIKEYPTASASVMHFRALLNELNLKRNFKPDIIFVDYINICVSSRIKMGAGVNSYTFIKAVAEELRGLAVEQEVPLITATQTNRDGFTASDVGLENVSESFGLPGTADFMVVIISNDDLDQLNQVMIKQLKNRYNDVAKNKRFVIGMDKAKMRIYEVEQSAQEDLADAGKSVFDSGKSEDKFKNFRF